MNQGIRDFVHCQTIAVVGASRTGKKFGNMAYRDLKKRGYDVLAVHPTAQTLEGDTCYASLRDLPRTPDGVIVSLPPNKVTPVLRDAADLGIRNVWLQ
ncbi:MAG TPA: CoA-binding protein, partial [Anaerolineae bacterium]|nr:CoA-binding protein [Anaerolineae bacterium]